MSNVVKVLFFATLKDAAGRKTTLLELPDRARVQDVKELLTEQYPNLSKGMGSALISVNREFAFDDDIIPPQAEIALFPPVSGGSELEKPTICIISRSEIDINKVIAGVTTNYTGAVAAFIGTVRAITNWGDAHHTAYLEYEAYESMAETKLHQLAEEIRKRWPSIEGIALVQRIGLLNPGTMTVAVACSAAHRDTGVFDACHYGIDRLKEIVPIWKKEVGPGGEEWVEGSYIPKVGE